MNGVYTTLLDLLFPRRCMGCRTKGTSLCTSCLASLRHPERILPKGVRAGFDYRDPLIRNALKGLKYYKKKDLGIILGKALYERVLEDLADLHQFSRGQPLLVIPVPLSTTKQKMRGYNQSRIIAEGIIAVDGNKILSLAPTLVEKFQNTGTQAHMSKRSERIANIKDCFRVTHAPSLTGRTVIVIDDIVTTGTTIKEVMKLCKQNGAKKVIGIAVAH